MATSGDSRKIVHDFASNLERVVAMADKAGIAELCELMDLNSVHLTTEFLDARMNQAKAVDKILGRMI